LFETASFPFATLSTKLDMAALNGLAIDQRINKVIEVNVDLHGANVMFEADMFITRIGPNKVLVESRTPVLVNAEEFGMTEGVAKLQELASLPSISLAVPVSFSLVFSR